MTVAITMRRGARTYYHTGEFAEHGGMNLPIRSRYIGKAVTFDAMRKAEDYMREERMQGWEPPWTAERVTLPEDAS